GGKAAKAGEAPPAAENPNPLTRVLCGDLCLGCLCARRGNGASRARSLQPQRTRTYAWFVVETAASATRAELTPTGGEGAVATKDRSCPRLHCTSSEQRPATSDQRPATSEQRAASSEQRAATSEQRPATSEQRTA